MVTLNSSLIWQIISFILPSNEYSCVYAWTTLGNIACDRLAEDAEFAKNHLFRWSSFWPWRVHLRHRKPAFSSCMIWHIISFILPPNEYGCVYAWTTLGSGPVNDAGFIKKKNIFSDEAHFDLGGCVNKQNYPIWGAENPHAYIEKPTHPKRVTV